MKKHLFITLGYFTLLLFAVLNTSLFAQTPIHTQFPTGINNEFTAVHLYNVDSNAIVLSYFASTNAIFNDIQVAVKVNKANLSVMDTMVIPNTYSQSLNNYGGGYISNSDFTKTFYAYSTTDNIGLTKLSFFNVNTGFEVEDTIFSIQMENKKIWFARFINNQFLLGYTNAAGFDSLFIKTFSIDGVLQSSREYNAFSQTDNQIYSQNMGIIGAVEHPQIEDAFILAHPTGNKIFVVNQITLDTIRTYNIDSLGAYLINYAGYWSRYNSQMRVDYDGVVLTGTVHLDPDTNANTNNPFDFQYYEFKQFWDGTFSIRDFGQRDIDNRGYASGINRITNIKVIAGAIPFSFASFTAAEKREVLLYIYDDHGKFDSIYLHGDYNHVPTELLVDDNGDIFITGMYTEAWGTGAAHAWLTKIPGLAVGMIEQNKINNHLFIYPNPTVQTIQIKEVSKFVNGDYEINNQSGVMVQQGKVTTQQIDVSQFVSGVYILTVRNQNGEQFNAIFVKE